MPVLADELHDELLRSSESPEWGVGPLLAPGKLAGSPLVLNDSGTTAKLTPTGVAMRLGQIHRARGSPDAGNPFEARSGARLGSL
jgi:hypothetical protein